MPVDKEIYLVEVESELPLRHTGIIKSIFYTIAILICGVTLWGALAPLSGAVIADGVVKIDTNRKTVQHFDGGIVKEILVKEGSYVDKGLPLITLENTLTSSNLTILNDQLDTLLANEARLSAEKKYADEITFPSHLLGSTSQKIVNILEDERAFFTSRKKSLEDQIALLNESLRKNQNAKKGYYAEIHAITEGINYANQYLDATEHVFNKGLIPKTDYWEAQRLLAEKKERLGSQQAAIARTEQESADLKLQIVSAKNDYIQAADDELKETRKAIHEIQERIKPAIMDLKRQTIVAPLAGQIINLKVSTVGGIIKASEPLMDIVPIDNELLIEAKVNTADFPLISPGQRAEIQLIAYSKIMPIIPGELVYVSGDALSDENPINPGHYYLVHIRADEKALNDIRSKNITLSPGMPVTTFIRTPARTFFEYLYGPIVNRMRRTFQES